MDNILRIGNIKRFAKQTMRGKWLRGIAVMLLYAVIQNAPSFILSYVTESNVVSYLLLIYRLLISGPLLMGVTCFFLDSFRGTEEPGLGSFGKGFSYGLKAIQLFVICAALIFLWSLLFVIPGILAYIRYSQSFFILADDPTKNPIDCIRESKYYMQGRKGRYFLLQLSFIGWFILAALPSSLLMRDYIDMTGIMSIEPMEEAIIRASQAPLVVVLELLVYIVMAYVLASNACFYDILSGNLKVLYREDPQDGETQGMY